MNDQVYKPTIKAVDVFHQLPAAYKAWIIRCEQHRVVEGGEYSLRTEAEAQTLKHEAQDAYKCLKRQFNYLVAYELNELSDELSVLEMGLKSAPLNLDLDMDLANTQREIKELERMSGMVAKDSYPPRKDTLPPSGTSLKGRQPCAQVEEVTHA